MCTRSKGKKQTPPQETEPDLPWSVSVPTVEVRVSSGLPQWQGLGCSRPGRPGMWNKSFWRRSPSAPLQSCWADDPQTGEQLHQRSSRTFVKVLGSTTDFQTWGSSKGTENPQGIWLWRPVGFDYRTSTGLGKQTLRGHKKTLCAPGPRRKEQRTLKSLNQTCPWVSRSHCWRRGLTVSCCRVRGTDCNRPGSPVCWHKSFWRRLPLPPLPSP